MIDIVGLSGQAPGLHILDLERRGWGVRRCRRYRDGDVVEQMKTLLNRTDGVTLDWNALSG